jgi:hypothetical protein
MKKLILAGASVAVLISPAIAADMPVKAPVYKAPPPAVSSGSWYFWVDGMYERVRLPSYALGIHTVANPGPNVDLGPTQAFDPSLNAGAVRGALGYIVPGSKVRFELGGSYVTGTGSSSSGVAAVPFAAQVVLLNGNPSTLNGFNCSAPVSCSMAGALSTSYDAWQVNGKVATDWKYGAFTMTPSAALFGGNTRNNQSLSETFTQTIFANTGAYSASTQLRWTDFGGRAGLDVAIPLFSAWSLGVGGWVGVAARTTSLNGTDAASSTTNPLFNGASTVSAGDSKSVFLANAEAGLAYAYTPNLILRGFGGLNYDDSVPGIAGPSFGGSVLAPTSTTAARVTYARETSYYAGGGFLWRF